MKKHVHDMIWYNRWMKVCLICGLTESPNLDDLNDAAVRTRDAEL